MTKITPNLLSDTLNVIQLARETARLQGQQAQAERLKPVVDNLRSLVSEARDPKPPVAVSGVMAQDDFKTLLQTVQALPANRPAVAAPLAGSPAPSGAERSQIVLAMSAGGMNDLDIARQMGMAREEVQLVLSMNRFSRS
jgi:hypothetical protein